MGERPLGVPRSMVEVPKPTHEQDNHLICYILVRNSNKATIRVRENKSKSSFSSKEWCHGPPERFKHAKLASSVTRRTRQGCICSPTAVWTAMGFPPLRVHGKKLNGIQLS